MSGMANVPCLLNKRPLGHSAKQVDKSLAKEYPPLHPPWDVKNLRISVAERAFIH